MYECTRANTSKHFQTDVRVCACACVRVFAYAMPVSSFFHAQHTRAHTQHTILVDLRSALCVCVCVCVSLSLSLA